MAFTQVQDLDSETAIALGGRNKKTGKANPTKAEGYFLGSKEVESQRSKTGKAFLHILQTANGNLGVWGKTDLDRKLRNVTPGTMVRITQSGMQEIPGKNPMYKFTVEVDLENVIEVSVATASSDNIDDDIEETDIDSGEDNGYQQTAAYVDNAQNNGNRKAASTSGAPAKAASLLGSRK